MIALRALIGIVMGCSFVGSVVLLALADPRWKWGAGIIALCLGAAALGDIGSHFPPGNPEYRDISSLALLGITRDRLKENGWLIGNIDASIVAEQPRLADYMDRIRQQLSETLGITLSQVSIKASTSEQLGFIGRGEGIAAWAVALLKES